MLILSHVIIAILSMGVSSLTASRPTLRRVLASYVFIGATVASGSVLIVLNSSDILKSCLVGLAYLVVVSFLGVVAHKRLQRISVNGE